ncbi:response regulator, partial [Candidatus Saccharibacteria bacterium]|nr:response regulator [Candidatus Saccharibacteria bacterium]
VMMPKISGFDMLDILRSTPETKDIKVIMMTALSSDDQRQRGESLGADKYLVKSQVGIEDVINAVHEVLGDKGTTSGEAPTDAPQEVPAPQGASDQSVQEASIPTVPTPAPVPEAAPAAPVTAPAAPAAAPAAPAPQQNTTAEAMEQLLNSAPETTNATWPGSPAK